MRTEELMRTDQFLQTLLPRYQYVMEAFGPDRFMFESNFPVDKDCISYRTLWNIFKKIAKTAPPFRYREDSCIQWDCRKGLSFAGAGTGAIHSLSRFSSAIGGKALGRKATRKLSTRSVLTNDRQAPCRV